MVRMERGPRASGVLFHSDPLDPKAFEFCGMQPFTRRSRFPFGTVHHVILIAAYLQWRRIFTDQQSPVCETAAVPLFAGDGPNGKGSPRKRGIVPFGSP